MGLLVRTRPQRGCHVPHRQVVSGELSSLRRKLGTLSAEPLNSVDLCFSKDVSTTFVPSVRYDVSIKASSVFNSLPTSPSIDFSGGYLLSFCVYCLLETQPLPAKPRQYGDGLSVLAQPGVSSF
jgi:hypothetical protein